MYQQSTKRPEPLPFRVSINTTKGLNIILSNRGIKNERPCSLFVTPEQAEQFTADLEAALSNGHYTCLDHCFLCGKPFIRTDDVCMLTKNREAHRKCFHTAIRKKQLTLDDRQDGYTIYFPYGIPEYDFSNFNDEGREFRYAIQIVSQKVIHLWMQEGRKRPRCHICLTHGECLRMIQEIREKASLVRSAEAGICSVGRKTSMWTKRSEKQKLTHLFRRKALRPVTTLLLLVLLLLTWQGTTVHAEYRGYTYEDADLIAKTVWGEARGCSVTQQAAVAWCILNRVDSAAFPNSIRAVVTQEYQFAGYCSGNPVELEILALVYDVLARWSLESEYADSVGRVLPENYLYFTGNGVENTFTETFLAKTAWDWSLPSPYETGGKEVSSVRVLVPCLSC